MALTKAGRIAFCSAFAGLMLVLSGCASTSELSSTQALKSEETARTREQVGGATYPRARLPELNEASRLNNFLAYAALNNPQLEAAFNRWKVALERVSQARTLPDPRFNYGYFIQEVETRVGPQEQQVGVIRLRGGRQNHSGDLKAHHPAGAVHTPQLKGVAQEVEDRIVRIMQEVAAA